MRDIEKLGNPTDLSSYQWGMFSAPKQRRWRTGNCLPCRKARESVLLRHAAMRKEHINEAHVFIADYAAWMLACGATCIRIRKNVQRMAATWNLEIELTIMPYSVHLNAFNSETEENKVFIRRIPQTGINFYKNTQLSRLSWDVADGRVALHEAKSRFAAIIASPDTNRWLVLLLASLANMSFCRIFGGDFSSMGIVFCATLIGFLLKQELLRVHIDVHAVFICCAFVSAVIGASGYTLGIGQTPEIALGTSVLYLIPGIPYINSISDMLVGQYMVAYSRFMSAMILTFCLSVGLVGGILLMNLKMF